MSTSKEMADHRNVIKFRVDLKMTPAQMFKQLRNREKYKSVSRSLKFKWHKQFSEEWREAKCVESDRQKIHSCIGDGIRNVIKGYVQNGCLACLLKMKRKDAYLSSYFLRRYARDRDFLNKIIIVKETWLHDT